MPRFLEAYAASDPAMILRSRGWAVLFALSLIAIGKAANGACEAGYQLGAPLGEGLSATGC
jgi:hypothetical protein